VEPTDDCRPKLVHVRRPLVRGTLTFEPAGPAFLELTVTPAGDAAAAFARVAELVDRLSEYDQAVGGAGVTRDAARSRAEPGAVTLVVVANDPAGAEARLEAFGRVAAAAVGYAGEAVRAEVKRSAA
jgi:hypothetical protein